MRSRGLAEGTAVVLGAVALTAVLTYPLAFQFDRIGRVNTDDGRWSIWVVSWVAHALTTDPAGVYQANIFYPQRNALAFSEANLVEGAIAAPVWAATKNPYATHNFAAFVSFVIAFVGAYYLARYLTGSRGAAIVAAILYAFSPFTFARTAHIQLLYTGGLPFCLLAFHRLADRPTASRALTLGVALWLQALACAYYGIFAGLMVGLATLVVAATRHRWRDRDYWIGIALAAFVSIALTVPFFLPYLSVQKDAGFARTLDDARMYSADVGAWLASAAWAHRWWLPWIEPFNEVLFPGVVALGLGIAGLALAWRQAASRELALIYGLTALLSVWLSFGPDAGLYTLFYRTIPIFTFLRAPGRIGIVVVLCLAVFAAVALKGWLAGRRNRAAWTAAIALLAAAELLQAPLTAFRPVEPFADAYRTLAVQPPGAVAEFPYFYLRSDFPRHAYYMLNSATHWMPLVNGYSDHIPQEFRDQVRPLSSFPTRESFQILGKVGARYVMFHLNLYDSRSRQRLIERLDTYRAYLRPLVQEGDVWLFEIVGFPN
ncbi:MAG TPA: hypothetical protein VL263_21570 [Vicinamibacterales bacterium]|nr:hypothetical protein [Vicinamibacterales bacterium]